MQTVLGTGLRGLGKETAAETSPRAAAKTSTGTLERTRRELKLGKEKHLLLH